MNAVGLGEIEVKRRDRRLLNLISLGHVGSAQCVQPRDQARSPRFDRQRAKSRVRPGDHFRSLALSFPLRDMLEIDDMREIRIAHLLLPCV